MKKKILLVLCICKLGNIRSPFSYLKEYNYPVLLCYRLQTPTVDKTNNKENLKWLPHHASVTNTPVSLQNRYWMHLYMDLPKLAKLEFLNLTFYIFNFTNIQIQYIEKLVLDEAADIRCLKICFTIDAFAIKLSCSSISPKYLTTRKHRTGTEKPAER